MNFIGQKAIVDGFKDKLNQKNLGHAYALSGSAGMGKRTLARYLAKLLLCTEAASAPCGSCRSCRSFEADSNPHFLSISAETQKILIKQIRGLIEDISIKPSHGRKVYLIEDADRMTPDAQNCLLKTLEEPPPYAVILMTTAFYESLLVTVRSRIVQIKMMPYNNDEMAAIAHHNGQILKGREHLLSWANGNPGRLLQLLGDKRFEENREKVLQFVFDRTGLSAIDLNQYLSVHKDAFQGCMDILESVYRDALLISCGAGDGLINSDKQDNIEEYVRQTSFTELTDKITKIQEVRSNLKHYMNYQLAVDMMTLVEAR